MHARQPTRASMLKSPTPSAAQLTTKLRLATGALLLFVAESRALRLARAASANPQTSTLGKVRPWHWTLLGAAALLMFGVGTLWSDYRALKRHGDFRL